MDKSGKVVIPFSYDEAAQFKNGKAVDKKANGYGLIDLSRKLLLEPIYEAVYSVNEGLIRARKNRNSVFR